MAKQKKLSDSVTAPKPALLKAVVVVRAGHLLSECYELSLEDGIVVDVKKLSRAPDLTASAIGHGASALWRQVRDQSVEDLPNA